jgi:RHS repeat-associated protein
MIRPALIAGVASLTLMSPTPQSDDFPSGNVINTVGATAAVTLDPGTAFDNVYTVHYFVQSTLNANSTTFGNAFLVVAIETNDGGGWVERATFNYNCGYLSGPPPYPTRTCPAWTHEQQAITVPGLGLNAGIRLKAKSFSTSNGSGGSFVIRGGDAGGTNPETYNGVTYSNDPAPPPSYAVEVGPDPGSQSAYAGSTSNVATFTVQNLGNQGTLTYALSVVGCTAPLTNCTSDAASINVAQGTTVNATVHFDGQNTTGTGTVTLRATYTPTGTSNDGTINVSLTPAPSYAVQVGPDPGSQSTAAGSTGNVASFTVQNLGNQGTLTYQLSIVGCAAPLTNCTSDFGSISVPQGSTLTTTAHFDAQGVAGTGSIVLRATHSASGANNDGTINVTVSPPSYAVQVGPDPGSLAANIGSTGNVATFTVQNQGNQGTLTYALSVVTCSSPLTNCTSDAGSISVGQGTTVNASVHFDAQNMAGTGTIVLRATHTASGATNDGTINVTATTSQTDDFSSGNAITTLGGTADAILNPGSANGGIYTVHYFVQTTINANSTTYGSASLVVAIETNDGSGWVERAAPGYTCGYLSGPPPYPTYTCAAWAHEQQTITVAGLGLNATIRLRAKSFTTTNGAGGSFVIRGGDGAGSNPETYNGVTYGTDVPPSYAVQVGPDPGSQSAYMGSTGNVATFTVTNQGNQGTLTYAVSIQSCAAPLTGCTSDSATISVGQGLTKNATVHFNAQNVGGTGTVVLRATHPASGTNNDGTINVTLTPPPSYAVEVGPDPGSQTTGAGTAGNVASFTVQNNGNQGTLTYALSIVTCGAPVTSCTSDFATISVGQGLTQNATVHFNAQSTTGTGAIVLRATHVASGTINDGTINVTVAPASFAVQVGPDPGSAGALMASSGNVATFTVTNQGNEGTVTYALSIAGCGTPLTNCTSDVATILVAQGTTQNATVHFDVQNMAGTGTMVLRATHTASGATNDGTINVTITTLQADDFTAGNTIAALNGTADAILNPGNANGGIYTVHYFVQTTINANSTTYGSASLVVAIETNDGSGWVERAAPGYTCGYLSGPPPYPTYTCAAWAHEQQTITVAGLGLNATIRLRAKSFTTTNGAGGSFVIRGGDGAGSNPETYNGVTYGTDLPPSYAVDVGDPTALTVFASSAGNVATFPVTNQGNQGTLTYQLSIQGCGASVINCTSDAPTITVGQGVTQNATVHFDAQSATGPGSIVLRATHTSSGAFNDGTISVTVAPAPSYTVQVGPDPGGQSANGGTTGNVATFTVQNTGNQGTLTYALSVAGCTAPVSNCASDSSTITVGQSASRNATVHFDAQTAMGAGVITLRATHTPSGAHDDGTINVTVVALSWVSGGALVLDSRFLLQETANTYDSTGQITRVTDARNAVIDFVYGGNPNNAFLTQVKRWKNGVGGAFLATNVGYTNGDVSSITDEGGTLHSYAYDAFRRLQQIRNSGGLVLRGYSYTYSRTLANSWTFQPLSPNAIIDSTYMQQTPLQAIVSTGYIDGLGREIQTVVQDGTNYDVAATEYDLMGRKWRVWSAYKRTTAGYDPAFATTGTDSANTYFSATAAKPYVETQYRPDPLDRVSRVIPQYIGTTPTIWTATSYGANTSAKYTITEVADESGNRTQHSTDLFGKDVQSILGYGTPIATITQIAFDVLGRRTRVVDPRGLVTTYVADTRGLVTSRSSPDAGTVQFKYDRVGSPRFVQDANQAAAGTVYFSNYDFAGRSLTSGLGTATFSALNPDVTEAFETTQGNWLVVRAYDAKPSTSAFPWNQFSSQITGAAMANVSGQLAAVASKSNSAWQVTLFSYDVDGQVATRYTYTQANTGTSVLTAVNAVVAYTRDLRGAPTQRFTTIGTKTFYQWYDYDNRGLLVKTFATTTATKPAGADVTDTYRSDGEAQNYQFPGGPVVPIRYTIRGQVQQIGDPAGTTFPFSARYVYRPNGTPDTLEFYSGGTTATLKRYRYAIGSAGYDALNRLKSADFSSWSGAAWTVTSNYDLSGINYDAAGNLLTLKRNRDTGTLIDNLTYAIPATSNRLTAVTDAVPATAETWDAESGSLSYDANGNITAAPAPYSITSVTYDPSNLPLAITRSGTTTNYRYDDAAQRITKQVGSTGNTEVYLREGPATLAVFTVKPNGTLASWYFNLLWKDRVVGRQPSTGARTFYHFDALGSMRAATQGASITESYDFEPWGLLMPGRTRSGSTKEGFTGKEQDVETGLTYFGARYFMPALGRWAAVDPVSDDMTEWSPYNYVYDNPLSHADPDGRQPPYMNIPPSSTEGARIVVEAGAHLLKGVGTVLMGPINLAITVLTLDENTPDFGPFTWIGQSIDQVRTGDLNEKMEGIGALAGGAGLAIYGARGALVTEEVGPASTLRPGPYARESIPLAKIGERATRPEQADINRIGRESGCHTCGEKNPGTASGNHVLDHQPPTKLNPPGNPQRGYPHCIDCMRRQGGEVNAERARLRRVPPPPPPPPPRPKPEDL